MKKCTEWKAARECGTCAKSWTRWIAGILGPLYETCERILREVSKHAADRCEVCNRLPADEQEAAEIFDC
jgi:UTP:GlnB (protein PII) uridylyltransferase